MTARLNTQDFIAKARAVHGDRYGYENVVYVNTKTKVNILCPKHGPFDQRVHCHLNGIGCPGCGGNRRLNTQDFIAKARAVHGDRYSYENVVYVNNCTKVEILCPIHGPFTQKPSSHAAGFGCAGCSTYSSRSNTKDFIIKARETHGDYYGYENVVYTSYDTKVEILCPKHGPFMQRPGEHSRGSGCPNCCGRINGRARRPSTQDFIDKVRKVNGDRYEYTNTEYINHRTKVEILCPIHGPFMQWPHAHMRGVGCRSCFADARRSNTQDFINKARKVHGDRYEYTNTEYVSNSTKAEILCSTHGPFMQRPGSHLAGAGCPTCNSSKGEIQISNWLNENNINYIPQASLPRTQFRFDFQTPSGYIEYQGRQHYEPIAGWGGQKHLKATQARDKFKRDWCRDHGFPLLLIGYWQDDEIPTLLEQFHLTNPNPVV
jgi:ribosomal protein L19E